MEYWQICDVIGIRFTRVVKTAFWIKRLRNTDYPTVIVLDFLKCSQIFSPRFHNLIFKGTILRQVGILPQTLVSDQFSNHPFFRFNHIVLYNADGQVLKFGTWRWTVNQSNHNYTYMCGNFILPEPASYVFILPVSKGGAHARENLMSLCQSCHTKIHRDLGDR